MSGIAFHHDQIGMLSECDRADVINQPEIGGAVEGCDLSPTDQCPSAWSEKSGRHATPVERSTS